MSKVALWVGAGLILAGVALGFVKDGTCGSVFQPRDEQAAQVNRFLGQDVRDCSIQWASVMVMGSITIFASGNKTEINHVNKSEGKSIVDRVRSRISDAGSVAPVQVAQPDTGPDSGEVVIAQIQKLGELRDAGILTPEEFDAKKTELLGRL